MNLSYVSILSKHPDVLRAYTAIICGMKYVLLIPAYKEKHGFKV